MDVGSNFTETLQCTKVMKENITDSEHLDILKNHSADLLSRINTYYDYLQIGYDKKTALNMTGLNENQILENNTNIDDVEFDTGIPDELDLAYGKIMDNYAHSIALTKDHIKTIKELAIMFGIEEKKLQLFIEKNRTEFLQKHYPQYLQMFDTKVENKIPTIWNGFCPESWAIGKTVRMRLNKNDFYESEETGLQIAIGFQGVQAVILNFRGESEFATEKIYADERDCNECLSPQTLDNSPFCKAVIFKTSEEVSNYITNIPKKVSKVTFDKTLLEKLFSEIENKLFDKNNIRLINYFEKDSVTNFESFNKSFLTEINKKSVVYCIWVGTKSNKLNPFYIGHVFETISKQRMIAHLSRKNEATGSKLENVKTAIEDNLFIGVTFVEIVPSYMRTSIEEWLISKYADKLVWNKNGKR